jgi:hypothetical protein
MNKQRLYGILSLTLSLFLLTQCTLSNPDGSFPKTSSLTPVNITKTLSPSFTSTISAYAISKTVTPTVTLTSTFTPTPTPTITQTALPTISAQSSIDFVQKLLTSDVFCHLPCFGGIKPGETNWQGTKGFLETISREIDRTPYKGKPFTAINHATFILPKGFDVQNAWIMVYENEQGKIKLLRTVRHNYPIQKILDEQGLPTEVYIYILDNPGNDKDGQFQFVIYYADQGILADYYGEMRYEKNLHICPSNLLPWMNYPIIWLWSPEERITWKDIYFDYSFSSSGIFDEYYPIKYVANIDVDKFYEIFKDSKNLYKCLDIPNPNINNK